MTNKRNTKFKIRRSILLATLTLIFVAFGGGSVSALDLSQESIEITDKSATTVVHDAGIGDLRITPNLEFNRLDDFISYKLVIKNNDGKKYRIVSITDDNSNEAIALTYSYPTEMDIKNKEIGFTVKYVKITNSPLKTINVVIKIVDEEDASEEIPIVIPNTGANTSFDTVSAVTVQSIIIYIVFAAICCAVYIIVRRKKMEKNKRVDLRVPKALLGFALLLGIIPVAVIAASFESIYFTVNLTEVKLNGPYVITFDTDEGGTSIPNQIVNNGDPIAKPSPDPERKGYTFEGWVDENGDLYDFDTPINGPVKISADWKPITYTIAYDLAGGTAGAPANKTEYTIETPDFTLTNPTKDHYDFTGWTGTDLAGPTMTVTIPKGSINDRSYTATWKVKEYKATFDTDGGTPAIEDQTKKYGETFTAPTTTITKDGYTLVGWLLNGADYDFSTPASADIELKAKWEAIPYNITYDLVDDATDPATVSGNPGTYTVEDTITLNNPTREHYDFVGWTGTDLSGPTMVVTIPINSTGDRSYTATWKKKEYTATFKDGDAVITIQTKEYMEQFTEPTKPTKTGYEFVEWQQNGAKYEFNTPVIEDITLQATWKLEVYNIAYNLDGGTIDESLNPKTYTINDTFTLNNPTKAGFDFDGWTGTGLTSMTKDVTITKGSTGPRNYTAHWTELFTVTFDVNGGIPALAPVDVRDGETVAEPAEPKRTDYVFKGWKLKNSDAYYDFSTEVTGDITLVAEWQVGKSTLSLDGKGMSLKMKQLANPSSGITNGYNYIDTRTKAFVRATEAQYNAAVNADLVTNANKISTNDSIAATYMWFDSSTGTMYYYTEAAKIYINGSMAEMFAKYTNLSDFSGLEDFDTSGANDMNRLFQDCPSFNDAALEYIKDWDTSNVTDMTFMFGANNASNGGNKITKLTALTNWDVSKVRSFYQAFKHATKLESLGELVDDPKNPGTQIYNGLGQWNVSSVGYESDTSVLLSKDNRGFEQMFNGCTSLTDADAIVDWDINNAVTSAVNAGEAISWSFVGMLRTAPVRTTQPAFTSWAPGGVWDDTGKFTPNAAP